MPRGKVKPVTIFRDPKSTRGGSRVVGQVKRGRKMKGSWSASFEPSKEWEIYCNSRDLQAVVGTVIFKHLRSSIKGDRNPETGRRHKRFASDTAIARQRAHVAKSRGDGKIDLDEMANSLRRTITDSTRRWGAGGKRISQSRTRMKFYFADRKYAAINKTDSTRKGKDRRIWLGVGGSVGSKIAPAIEKWLDVVLEGQRFDRDTGQRARSGIGPGVKR
jgi:hypothetical protein